MSTYDKTIINGKPFITFTWSPTEEQYEKLKAASYRYAKHVLGMTHVDNSDLIKAMETVIDGCIEEGWTLDEGA